MISTNRFYVAAALWLAAFASPAWAATTVNVVEAGEGGDKMSLKLDPTTIAAGPTTFTVKNDAATEEHEMVVVKLKSPDQKIPMMKGKNRVDEAKLNSMGEVSEMKPGASGEMNADLKPGTYLLFCNIKGHYEAGMYATLTVTK